MVSQLLTLYITPVIYVYLDRMGQRASHWGWLGRGKPAAAASIKPHRPSGGTPAPAE
jgi:hypothetical protein